jgi:uncharacterized cupin superfamily protein
MSPDTRPAGGDRGIVCETLPGSPSSVSTACVSGRGVWSSQRYWHGPEDEVGYVVSGELILVTDEGEQAMRRAIARAQKGW